MIKSELSPSRPVGSENKDVTTIFCIVGPTAAGKSDLAADIAVKLNAEIVNADAFQIYEGFDRLSAKPSPDTLSKAPHHLIGVISVNEEMSAAKYRALALPVIADIAARGKLPLVVGGTGLYIKALTHGLDQAPAANRSLREELDRLNMNELRLRLTALDPTAAQNLDLKNRRRVVRAIEIAELTGRPISEQRSAWTEPATDGLPTGSDVPVAKPTTHRRLENRRSLMGGKKPFHSGVLVFRDRDELYQRINQRVEAMLRQGAVDEVRDTDQLSRTAEQMIGIRDIREYLAGQVSLADCAAKIQQSTRRYAKRQLTWFHHQSSFESLNLSLLKHNEAVEWVLRRALAAAPGE
jgi:tRNA dimethylallyltransferase